jgi:hypothetical protein
MSDNAIFARLASETEVGVVQKYAAMAFAESTKYRGHMDFRPLAATGDTITIVGGAGVTIFGTVSLYDAGEGRWFVNVLFVEPIAREVGIGNAMIALALEELRRHKAKNINAAALPGDRSTKNLFERHGLVAQMITVGKQL